jgi:hypothetical protein
MGGVIRDDMKALLIVVVTAVSFSLALHLVDNLSPMPHSDLPWVRGAWLVFLTIGSTLYILVEKYKTHRLRGIEWWREKKKIETIIESSSAYILMGMVLGIAFYQLLWKRFIV